MARAVLMTVAQADPVAADLAAPAIDHRLEKACLVSLSRKAVRRRPAMILARRKKVARGLVALVAPASMIVVRRRISTTAGLLAEVPVPVPAQDLKAARRRSSWRPAPPSRS